MSKRQVVSSGVEQLDQMLGGLFIGDNVVWQDDAGSLADVFARRFISSSREAQKPLIYVSFDRSPKNLLDKLGPLAEYPQMVILDCFTCGRGGSAELFMKFYENPPSDFSGRLKMMEHPGDPDQLGRALYDLHATLGGDVRLVFESLTGMAELWGGEDALAEFYAAACPRLYELDTIAYWVMEKEAHSSRLKARIGHTAQVVIELSIKRGTTYLSILKADKRQPENRHKPIKYWSRDEVIDFEGERSSTGLLDLGRRLKSLRAKKGLSQSDLARMVGVTPSTISQVESNLIYPSLPALIKMAEMLGVEMASLFAAHDEPARPLICRPASAVDIKLPGLDPEAISAKLVTPMGYNGRAEPYLIEMQARQSLGAHFFGHKGEEMGYVLSGTLEVKIGGSLYRLEAGDLICLTTQEPTGWTNPGDDVAKLLWIKMR